MRLVRSILGLAFLLVVLAACSSGEPGWTYAPPPSETPAGSGAPSGEPASAAPSGAASGAPSAAPSAEPSTPASAAPTGGGEVVQVSAVNIAFDQATLTVPADAPFQIEFANNDPGIPHNVAIRDSGGTEVFTGEIFNGVETRTYDIPALPAGAYQFICTVHPNMVIEVTAE